MTKNKLEFSVGLFVLFGCGCVFWLLTELGGIRYGKDNRYTITAYFTSVSGLKNGAIIEMAGVQVGTVTQIELDIERSLAHVYFAINNEISLTDDTIASVKTSGIIGDKYISLLPGGSEDILEEGDAIYNTESSLDIESLVSKYIFEKDED